MHHQTFAMFNLVWRSSCSWRCSLVLERAPDEHVKFRDRVTSRGRSRRCRTGVFAAGVDLSCRRQARAPSRTDSAAARRRYSSWSLMVIDPMASRTAGTDMRGLGLRRFESERTGTRQAWSVDDVSFQVRVMLAWRCSASRRVRQGDRIIHHSWAVRPTTSHGSSRASAACRRVRRTR